jgi:hypothetical protein
MSDEPDYRITTSPAPPPAPTLLGHVYAHFRRMGPVVAWLGCLVTGCAGLAGGCQNVDSRDPGRLAGAGLCLLASAAAFGLVAVISRHLGRGPDDPGGG